METPHKKMDDLSRTVPAEKFDEALNKMLKSKPIRHKDIKAPKKEEVEMPEKDIKIKKGDPTFAQLLKKTINPKNKNKR